MIGGDTLFTVVLYAHSKRLNSTKRPGEDNTGRVCNGVLVDESGILSPNISFDFNDSPAAYNYAYIQEFDRYYYIREWTMMRNLWYASMEVDPLASWRDLIGLSYQYVLRSSAAFDGNVADNAYPIVADPLAVYTGMSSTNNTYNWTANFEQGCYVVGIINGEDDTVGCVSYYRFTNQQFRNLCDILFADPTYLDIDVLELSNGLQRLLANPFQYVASAMWFPFDIPAGAAVSSVMVGWWQFAIDCNKINPSGVAATHFEFTLPQHPQSGDRGRWLNTPPYTQHTLFVPCFGEFEIPSATTIDTGHITVDVYTDMITGQAHLIIDGGRTLYKQGSIGVPLQLAALHRGDNFSTELQLGGLAAQFYAQSTIPSLVINEQVLTTIQQAGEVASTIGTALMPVSTSGSNGGVSVFNFYPRLKSVFQTLADEDMADHGRPLCKVRQLKDIPGYILCHHAEFDEYCTASENRAIVGFMEGGFFYE